MNGIFLLFTVAGEGQKDANGNPIYGKLLASHLDVQTTYDVDPNCTVTLNGLPGCIEELASGDSLILDGKPVVGIVATRTPVAQAARKGFLSSDKVSPSIAKPSPTVKTKPK